MLSIQNLAIHFTGNELFKNVSFVVAPQERVGLVGKNGAGKTTLLNIIAGKLLPQEGEVSFPKDYQWAYLHQELNPQSEKAVFDEAITAFDTILKWQEKEQELGEEIAARTDYESVAYHKLIDQMATANEQINILGGNEMNANTEKILLGLGFRRSDFDKPLNTFSNGWQMRVELAKMLLTKPDLLLLDEPTNHLDIESIQWLESYLKSYPGAVMMVSHDRAFLDAVTTRTIEIANARIYDYKTNYSKFVKLRKERLEQQRSRIANQEKEVKEMEEFIERFRYKATKAKQVQSRVKTLEKMEKIETDDLENAAIHFRFPPAPHSGKVVLKAVGLSKSYGDKEILKNIEFMIDRGEKIALVGKNGEGKTTLVKMIMGELDYVGNIEHGHLLKIGYLAQNHSVYLNDEDTVFDTLDHIAVGEARKQVRGILGSFLFRDEEVEKKVKVLSGGEKSRLSLAKLLLSPSNLIILDEPTNHLDMMSKEILKNALKQYNGTLLIVSHDRDFLQGLTSKVFEFRNRGIKEHLGDIYDFIRNKKMSDLKDLESAKRTKSLNTKEASLQKLNYEERKGLEKERRKIKNKIKKIEQKIELLEEALESKMNLLSSPENISADSSIHQVSMEYNRIKKELEQSMEEWEVAESMLED